MNETFFDDDNGPMSGGASISDDGVYRGFLWRSWSSGPSALWLALNPSTADGFAEDPTTRRMRSFTEREGCDGYGLWNLYSLRATDPSALDRHPDPVGPGNDALLQTLLNQRCAADDSGPVIVAWGANPMVIRSGRDQSVLAMIEAAGLQPMCLGVTKNGLPRHPLYLRRDAPLIPYRGRGHE